MIRVKSDNCNQDPESPLQKMDKGYDMVFHPDPFAKNASVAQNLARSDARSG
jgi:hypothetical protein